MNARELTQSLAVQVHYEWLIMMQITSYGVLETNFKKLDWAWFTLSIDLVQTNKISSLRVIKYNVTEKFPKYFVFGRERL